MKGVLKLRLQLLQTDGSLRTNLGSFLTEGWPPNTEGKFVPPRMDRSMRDRNVQISIIHINKKIQRHTSICMYYLPVQLLSNIRKVEQSFLF